MKSHLAAPNGIFPLIALGNESPVATATDNLAPGVIALVNDSRVSAATYSEPLTQFISRVADPENLLAAVDYIAPPIPVGRRFEWKKADNAQDFLTETDDERAIGAGFKRVEYSGSTQLGKTVNRGLMYVLDTDEDGGATTEEVIVAMLQQRVIRNKYRRAMTALLALSAGTGAVFSSATAPDEIIRTALATTQTTDGVYANRGLIGLAGWNFRKAAYAVQNNAGGYAGMSKSAADLAGDLMLDSLNVDKSLYQVSGTAKARIVGSNFIGFTARDGLNKDDASNLKQFYTPAGGGRFRVYRRVFGPGDKFVELIVEHYETIIGTSTVGVTRLNITAS